MCGIAGVLHFDQRPAEGATVEQMLSVLRHRGPDDEGVRVLGPVGLGHTRLSILDLEGGAQPMPADGGRYWITFNGEIFNYIELRDELMQKGHRFRTRSDTEVILHAYQEYGEDCVHRFNGQWAFAIWDEAKRKLFLARDRVGVRPLYHTQTGDSFYFASEIKALLQVEHVARELDLEALNQIFTFWVTIPPRTAFRNIWELPPGHLMVVERGTVRVQRYWRPTYRPQVVESERDERRLAGELRGLLEDATRIRLRSDVPVGAYLSGGLDSSFITALTAKLVGSRLRTFSVSFDEAEFDETRYQREVSKFLQTRHSDVRCSLTDIGGVFPDVIWHTEQPILRTAPAPLYLLSRLVRESGFKVVLTGEGADEMFGGYDIFKEAKVRRFWARQMGSRFRPLLLKRLYPYMEAMQNQPQAYLQSFFHLSDADLSSPFFSHLPRWELTAKAKLFFSNAVREQLRNVDPIAELRHKVPDGFERWNPFHQAEYLEAAQLLPGYILSSQGDRMAMAHSVEGRYPFLDHRVVEFASMLPPQLKMKVLREKYLLRRAAQGRIPESILARSKQPYRAPDAKSFFQPEPDYVNELLSPKQVAESGIFDPSSVAALVTKCQRGRAASAKDNMALVGILSTQILVHQFLKHKRGAPPCKPRMHETYAISS